MGGASIPETYCGFELRPEDVEVENHINDLNEWHKQINAVCCWRPVWTAHGEAERCFWHADVDEKPIEDLHAHRADGPERLDGAVLRETEVTDQVSFAECGLYGAIFQAVALPYADFGEAKLAHTKFREAHLRHVEFSDADLWGAVFSDADLWGAVFSDADPREAEFTDADLREAEFSDAVLWGAEFSDAVLWGAEFSDADLRAAVFSDAHLRDVEFSDADLRAAVFSDANLRAAVFSDANLRAAEFPGADLQGAEFPGADLQGAEFPDVDLQGAEFPDADLRNVDFSEATAIAAIFRHANLQDAVLADTDCRYATFSNALLYETVFEDTRINSKTTFYDPATSFYDVRNCSALTSRLWFSIKRRLGYDPSPVSRPICVYEVNQHIEASEEVPDSESLPDGVDRFTASRWVYRRLEALHEENALSEEARGFHISKEEAERKSLKEDGDPRRHVKTLMWSLSKHGESVRRLLMWWAGIIIAAGVMFPFVGGIKGDDGTEYALTSLTELGTVSGLNDLLLNIYFSVITFSTIGYGDLSPAGPWSRFLVAAESLAGAVLVALLIFVLGRRVTR